MDSLLLSRVGSTLFLQCPQHHSLSSPLVAPASSTRDLDSCPSLPFQLGTRMITLTSFSESRGKIPELPAARRCSMRKGDGTYPQGPCSRSPSRLPGPAAHSRSTPRGPSLGLLSPSGSRRSSWPEPHHQAHGAGRSGTPWREDPLPAGCPEAPALGSADGWRAASGPDSGWSGSDSW